MRLFEYVFLSYRYYVIDSTGTVCVSDVYRRVRVLGDVSYVLPQSQNDLLALRTWHIDGEYLAR